MSSRKIPRRYFLYVCLLLIGIFVSFYASVLSNELGNNAPDILKSLADADAALIGFLGIITVFILTSYRSESRDLDKQLRELDLLHARQTQQNIGQKEVEDYTNLRTPLDAYKRFIRNSASNCCYWAFEGVICFVISILFCLLSMSVLSNKDVWLAISIAGMSFGITFTFYEIWDYTRILT
jgi:hypothetical protein